VSSLSTGEAVTLEMPSRTGRTYEARSDDDIPIIESSTEATLFTRVGF
jgi:hypothetical protein